MSPKALHFYKILISPEGCFSFTPLKALANIFLLLIKYLLSVYSRKFLSVKHNLFTRTFDCFSSLCIFFPNL